MTIALTVLLGLISIGMLAGRVYEILKLTDLETGFFIYKGVVFNPYIIAVFIIITVCCAVLIFGGSKEVKPFFSKSSKIIAIASGAMFIIYGVMSIGGGITPIFVIVGGIALVLTGIFELKPTVNVLNIAIVVMFVVFVAGLCLDVIIFNVSTIYNVEFTKNAIAYLSAGLFLIFVMKNVFLPSVYSPMLLYITGIIAFVMCGIMNTADIIAMAIDGQARLPQLFFNAGFGFLGFFAFDNAISVMPSKIKQYDDTDTAAEEIAETSEYGKTETAEENSEAELYKQGNVQILEQADETQCHSTVEMTAETAEIAAAEESTQILQAEGLLETDVKHLQANEKKPVKKFVFTKNGDTREISVQKDSGKVVYKKPKN